MRYNKHTMGIAEKQKLEVAAMDIESISAIGSIAFVAMAENGNIDEITAGEHMSIFAPWEPNISYSVGNLRVYPADGGEQKLYKCIQAHTSQSNWTPDIAKSLWTTASDPAIEYPDWSQPVGAHDAYQTDDRVSHKNKHWVSTIDNNVWEPGVYGWSEEA